MPPALSITIKIDKKFNIDVMAQNLIKNTS